MLAFLSVWIGALALLLSTTMVVYRPAFNDVSVPLVVFFGSPGAMCLGGIVLWTYRKEEASDHGVSAQRVQAKIAIALAILAAAIVYLLVIFATPVESAG